MVFPEKIKVSNLIPTGNKKFFLKLINFFKILLLNIDFLFAKSLWNCSFHRRSKTWTLKVTQKDEKRTRLSLNKKGKNLWKRNVKG